MRAQSEAPLRLDRGRLTVVHYEKDTRLAQSMIGAAAANDTFPGLPRPSHRVLLAIAPSERVFREWVGPAAPEWGEAIAFPESQRIVIRGRDVPGGTDDPGITLRHEIAHLALHEALGNLPPRWFDEGYASYAAGEWRREDWLATSMSMVFRRLPPLDDLDAYFYEGEQSASQGYALAHRAVAELASIDREHGLTLFFRYWKETESLDGAMRRAYGMTSADFEELWRSRTRRRYGALALTADFAVIGVVGGLTLVPLWLARRRRNRRRLEAMRGAEAAAERAARESALANLLGEVPEAEPQRRDAGGSGGAIA